MWSIRVAAATVAALLAAGTGTADAAPRPRPRVDVAITTRPGSVLVGLPAGGGRAEGTAAATAGVRRVTVVWCGNGQYLDGGGWTCGNGFHTPVVSVEATLACATAARTRCAWNAPAPVEPSRYFVFAVATDKGGRFRAAGPVDVVVA